MVKEHRARFPMPFKSTQPSLAHSLRQESVSSLSFLSCKMDLWTQHIGAHVGMWYHGKSACVAHLKGQTKKKKRIIRYKAKMISSPNTWGDLWEIVLCEGQGGVLLLKEGSPSMMLLCAEPGARYP